MTENYESPGHKRHKKIKVEMLCMIYKLIRTNNQKINRFFSVETVSVTHAHTHTHTHTHM